MSAHTFPGDEGTCRWSPEAPVDARDGLMITCGGVCAERLLLGAGEFDVAEKFTVRAWIETIRGVSRGSFQGVLDEQEEFIHAMSRADRILRSRRGLLDQIARHLGRNGALTGDEIESIAVTRNPALLLERLNIETHTKWYP